jgi:hypothetical protein
MSHTSLPLERISSDETDAMEQVLEPGVRPERIEGGPPQDGRVKTFHIGLFEPNHRLIFVVQTHVDQGDLGSI